MSKLMICEVQGITVRWYKCKLEQKVINIFSGLLACTLNNWCAIDDTGWLHSWI